MDFSGVYDDEMKKGDDILWLDCSDITGCDMYCSDAAEKEIGNRIDRLGIHGIHYIDSGNYHYVTKIMTDRIKEPFSLLLFDHHTDMQKPMVNMISCGDWAGVVLDNNKYLRQLVLVGPPGKDIANIVSGNKDKLITFSEEELQSKRARNKMTGIDKSVPVYISIDKDVLNKDISETNWSQGFMSIELLEYLLKPVLAAQNVIGIDICGECERGISLPEYMEAEEKNGEVNRELYEFLKDEKEPQSGSFY